MKVLKRDTLRELFVSCLISLGISLLVPQPLLGTNLCSKGKEEIHVAVIMKGVGSGRFRGHELKYQFVTMYRSILKHAQSGLYDLHFILLTDKRSVPYLEKIMRKFIGRDVVKGSCGVSYEFVDTRSITGHYREAINEIRPLFTSHSEKAKKYTDDLFLMGPFYHRVFPYQKLIVLDADLKFRLDISQLYEHFNDFTDDQVMGVGIDLAPHYRIAFREYRKNNPGTRVGEPGRFQVQQICCRLETLDASPVNCKE